MSRRILASIIQPRMEEILSLVPSALHDIQLVDVLPEGPAPVVRTQ